jgi:hypothetical protein
MVFGSAVVQDVPKGPRPGYVGDSRDRARDVKRFDAICACRPLKPPALRCAGGEVAERSRQPRARTRLACEALVASTKGTKEPAELQEVARLVVGTSLDGELGAVHAAASRGSDESAAFGSPSRLEFAYFLAPARQYAATCSTARVVPFPN